MMHLSTVVISEFEVRQRVTDLGLNNFMILLFNMEHAIVTARVFDDMSESWQDGDSRVAVKDDAQLIGQCAAVGISHFIADDAVCARKLASLRSKGTFAGLPHPINLHDGFWEGWFKESNQGHLI